MLSHRHAAATIAAALALAPVAAHAATSPSKSRVAAKSSADCAGADAVPTQSNLPTVRAATLCLLNVERMQRGRSPLRANKDLAIAAGNYARTMVDYRFFAHVSPSGSTLVSRVKKTSYLARTAGWSLGENLAWGQAELGSPARTVSAWMRSPGHRRNILDETFDEIGVGVAYGTPGGGEEPGATYATEFGARAMPSKR